MYYIVAFTLIIVAVIAAGAWYVFRSPKSKAR